MKLPLVFVVLAGVSPAAPVDKVILAAMKLSEQPSYSWVTTVNDDARAYDIEGKAVLGQATWVRLPMVKAIAQRLGRDASTSVEAVFRGPDVVLHTEKGWQTLKELPKRHRDWRDSGDTWVMMLPPPHTTNPIWARGAASNDPFMDPFPVILHSPATDDEERRPYCNAQFGLSHPHEELGVIVSSCLDMRVDGDTATGVLSELGAQLLLVRDGQDNISLGNAGGLFRLHLKNGFVTKYSLRLEGILFVDRRKVHVRQNSTTTLANVGNTSFELPEEARRKLGF